MTTHPRHVTEEDLILHYYGEAPDERPVEQHLASCAECGEAFERLKQLLRVVEDAGFNPADAPVPGPAFEREIWARVAPQIEGLRSAALIGRGERWWTGLFQGTRKWALAGGIAALVLAAFAAGRFSTPAPPSPPESTVAESNPAAPNVAQRVLVVAVVDHLDHSQMVLLELLNADFEGAVDLSSEQLRARDLVTANRLYRQTALQTGDAATGAVLDELERVLLEIANTPQDATREDLEALRARVASGGLLFKVRIVHSEMLERERESLVSGSQS